jgi:antitoxin MazE
MKLKIVKIGNSKGVRIPKDYLRGFDEETFFELERDGDKLILSPAASETRKEWVKQMRNEQPESEPFILNEFDEQDWEWK